MYVNLFSKKSLIIMFCIACLLFGSGYITGRLSDNRGTDAGITDGINAIEQSNRDAQSTNSEAIQSNSNAQRTADEISGTNEEIGSAVDRAADANSDAQKILDEVKEQSIPSPESGTECDGQ